MIALGFSNRFQMEETPSLRSGGAGETVGSKNVGKWIRKKFMGEKTYEKRRQGKKERQPGKDSGHARAKRSKSSACETSLRHWFLGAQRGGRAGHLGKGESLGLARGCNAGINGTVGYGRFEKGTVNGRKKKISKTRFWKKNEWGGLHP